MRNDLSCAGLEVCEMRTILLKWSAAAATARGAGSADVLVTAVFADTDIHEAVELNLPRHADGAQPSFTQRTSKPVTQSLPRLVQFARSERLSHLPSIAGPARTGSLEPSWALTVTERGSTRPKSCHRSRKILCIRTTLSSHSSSRTHRRSCRAWWPCGLRHKILHRKEHCRPSAIGKEHVHSGCRWLQR